MITKPDNIDDYIAGFPEHTQKILQQIRLTIKKTVPKAAETISYGIPSFNLHDRYLIYFAGYQKHIGVYPVPVENIEFEKTSLNIKHQVKARFNFLWTGLFLLT